MTDLSRGPDRLVHDHIKAVYDFAHDLFALLDTDRLVDAVFRRAENEPIRHAAPDAVQWQLFRYVVEAAIDEVTERPSLAAAPAHDARRRSRWAITSTDEAVRAETRRLRVAHDLLAPEEQIILRLLTMVAPLPDAAYPIILGLDPVSAERAMAEVRRRFRGTYAQAAALDEAVAAPRLSDRAW